jgi:protein-S-isoprenylcysteine O-methyltransferase
MSSPSLNIRRVLRDETESDPNIQLMASQKPKEPKVHSVKDEIHIFDGENSPQNISVYGFLLGMVCSAGLMFTIVSDTKIPQFGIFLAALSLFHFLEYIATALFNADKLSLDCKVLLAPCQVFVADSISLL